MRICLIRHGETDWNRINRMQGREDIPLNEAGVAQAHACGEALQGLGIEAVYTSPLKRARRTAEEIASCVGLTESDVHPMEKLIERDLGIFSGKCVEDRKKYFSIAASEDSSAGMEPFADVGVRMQQALEELSGMGYQTVAAVSHGAAINVLLAGLSDHEMGTGKTKLHNGGITIIEGNTASGFRIQQCNLLPSELNKAMLTKP